MSDLHVYDLGKYECSKREILTPHQAISWMRDLQRDCESALERASNLPSWSRGDHFEKDLGTLIYVLQGALVKALVLKEEAFKPRTGQVNQ